jgi:hypothetical protein
MYKKKKYINIENSRADGRAVADGERETNTRPNSTPEKLTANRRRYFRGTIIAVGTSHGHMIIINSRRDGKML